MSEVPGGAPQRTVDSSGERSYAIPFHDVWEAAAAAVGGLRDWSVLGSDSRGGTLHLGTADRFGRHPLPGEVRLWLDELGQTRLEIRVSEPERLLRRRSGGGRVKRFLARLDAVLAPPRGRCSAARTGVHLATPERLVAPRGGPRAAPHRAGD